MLLFAAAVIRLMSVMARVVPSVARGAHVYPEVGGDEWLDDAVSSVVNFASLRFSLPRQGSHDRSPSRPLLIAAKFRGGINAQTP